MNLVHCANKLLDVTKILRQGLKSPKETGISWYLYTRDSDIVSFTALEKGHEHDSNWGNYFFILNPEWVKQNTEQFREHSEQPFEKNFSKFVKNMNIQPYEGYYERVWNQILSLKSVPVEGISELIAPNSDLDFLNFYVPENIRLRAATQEAIDVK